MADKIVGVYDIKVDQAVKNLNKLEKEVKDVGTQSKKTAKDTEQQYTKLSKNLSGSFKNMGRNLAGAFAIGSATAIFASAVKSAVNVAKGFEAQMSRVRAITGATSKDFERLSDNAKKLGSSTRFTSTQVAELQEEFAKLGFSTSEILNATEATLSLATATGSDLAESANVAGAVLRSFGLDAEETQRVVDVMALSFSKSALNMTDFSEAMKFVAPIAKSANIEIETVTALLGKLADSGLRGSIAGTGLKNLLAELSNESSGLAKKVGFAVKNSNDLTRAFEVLATKNIDLTEALALTDRRSAAAFTTLIRGAEDIKVLNQELINAKGAADKMADTMENNFAGSVTKLSSAWEGLMLRIAGSNGTLKIFVDLMTDYINLTNRVLTSEEDLHKQDIAANAERGKRNALTIKEIEAYKKVAIAAGQYEEVVNAMFSQELSGRVDFLNKKIAEQKDILKETEGTVSDSNTQYGVQKDLYEDTAGAISEAENMLAQYEAELEETLKTQQKFNKELEDGGGEGGDAETYTYSIAQLNKELKDLKDEFKKAEIGSDDWNNKVIEISKKTSELEAATRKATAQLVMFQQAARGFDPFAVDELDDRGAEGIGLDFKDIESEVDDISDKITEPIDLYAESVANGTDIADDLWQQHFNNVMFMQDQAAENDKKNKEEQEARFYDFYNASMDLFANLSQLQRNLNEEELNNLAAQLERGQITREEYDAKRKEIMREQAESDKALAIFDATVNGASAIVNALNTDPTGILSAIVGASVAAQIAAIASQPLPQFADGGFINEHGEFVGRKHSQGGVKIEAEGGEFITAAKYAQPNKDILKAINSGGWEKYKVENIIAPAIEQVLEGGLQGLGASYSLQNNFNDRNLLKAIDRHRSSDKDGFMYLAKELKRMNPRKRGGFA